MPIKKGFSRVCVPVAGTYNIRGAGCHKFAEPTVVRWNTEEPGKPLAFSAVGHTVSGYVESSKQVDDLIVRIEKGNGSLVEL